MQLFLCFCYMRYSAVRHTLRRYTVSWIHFGFNSMSICKWIMASIATRRRLILIMNNSPDLDCRSSVVHFHEGKLKKGKLGANAMKRVAAGAHLPTPWLFEPAYRPGDRADYCLDCCFSFTSCTKLYSKWKQRISDRYIHWKRLNENNGGFQEGMQVKNRIHYSRSSNGPTVGVKVLTFSPVNVIREKSGR